MLHTQNQTTSWIIGTKKGDDKYLNRPITSVWNRKARLWISLFLLLFITGIILWKTGLDAYHMAFMASCGIYLIYMGISLAHYDFIEDNYRRIDDLRRAYATDFAYTELFSADLLADKDAQQRHQWAIDQYFTTAETELFAAYSAQEHSKGPKNLEKSEEVILAKKNIHERALLMSIRLDCKHLDDHDVVTAIPAVV